MGRRYIDADKLKAHYAWWKGGTREMTMDEAKNDFDTIIDLQPTFEPTASTCFGCNCPKMEKLEADPIEVRVAYEQKAYNKGYADGKAESVKHGRWLRTDAYPHRIYCSECYATFIRNDEFLKLNDIPHNYCPNCGAKMDAQIGEDKSHPFAESVMMGMDGGENG